MIATRPPRAVLAAGLRLPQARAGGAYAREDAGHLGACVARELLARTGVDPGSLDEVIAGCVGPPHDQANVGRVLALRAGIPRPVPARTAGRNCGSGMEAVAEAVVEIECGRASLVLCAGVEAMSAYPVLFDRGFAAFLARLTRARTIPRRLAALASFRPRMLTPHLSLIQGLVDPISGMIMGRTAETLAREFGISREESDAFALESHRRAQAARDGKRLAREIVPHLPLGAGPRGESLEHDDGIRDGLSMASLAKLPPYFDKPDGTVTVGNACGITDGATALLVAAEDRARALGLTPLARVKGFAWAGCDPARMGLGPAYATARLLAEQGLDLSSIGVIEINEAFAAQVLACRKAFASERFARDELHRSRPLGALDPERTNRNGGAIALGHPVGATGARLLLTLAHELAVADRTLGLATLCIGGGQGGAMLLERVA